MYIGVEVYIAVRGEARVDGQENRVVSFWIQRWLQLFFGNGRLVTLGPLREPKGGTTQLISKSIRQKAHHV